jgi:hypothetical protein
MAARMEETTMMTTTPPVLPQGGIGTIGQWPRLRLTCALRLYRGPDFPLHLTTEEVSCEGFTCISPLRFSEGETLECEWTIGSDVKTALMGALVLRCSVEVTRSSYRAIDGGYALACRLLDYMPAQRYRLAAVG